MRRAWPAAAEAPRPSLGSQARPSPRDHRWLSRILRRLGPAQGRTAGKARWEGAEKKLEQRQRRGPSRETLLTPKSPVPLWWGEGSSGYRIPLPSCLHPTESHLKGQGQQHMQEGSHVVSISHPDLQPRNVRAALPGTTTGSSAPGPASGDGSGQMPWATHGLGEHRLGNAWGAVRGGGASTWFQGRLTVKPRPLPRPTASASDSRRHGQKCPCS